jgi:hypothetical protein
LAAAAELAVKLNGRGAIVRLQIELKIRVALSSRFIHLTEV